VVSQLHHQGSKKLQVSPRGSSSSSRAERNRSPLPAAQEERRDSSRTFELLGGFVVTLNLSRSIAIKHHP
jgi:hypothetical protein